MIKSTEVSDLNHSATGAALKLLYELHLNSIDSIRHSKRNSNIPLHHLHTFLFYCSYIELLRASDSMMAST